MSGNAPSRRLRLPGADPELRRALLSALGYLVLIALFTGVLLRTGRVRPSYTLGTVAAGGALLGAVSGALGSFSVLRRESLLGDALSHAALPGVAVAFLLVGRSTAALLVGAGVASWLGVLFIRGLTRFTRVREDSAMGVVLAGWFAAGIVGLTYIQGRSDASQAGLDTFIFGQAASMVRSDVRLLAGVALLLGVVLLLFWRQFKLVTFDMAFAGASGLRPALWTGLLSLLIVTATVMGLQLAGVILMVGMLIAPGVAARQWTDRLEGLVPLAAVFGAGAGALGAVLSAAGAGLPTGPMIILVVSVVVAVSLSLAPRRGLVWTSIRSRQDVRRFAERTVLRDIYHYAWDHDGVDGAVPHEFVVGVRGRHGRQALDRLLRRGLVTRVQTHAGSSWYLTPAGQELGSRDARNQQLWDLYREMRSYLHLPLVGEQRDRDIRAVLPAESVAVLEEFLAGREGEPRVRD